MSTFPWISSNNLIHVKLYSHYSKTLSRVKIPDILSLKYRKNKWLGLPNYWIDISMVFKITDISVWVTKANSSLIDHYVFPDSISACSSKGMRSLVLLFTSLFVISSFIPFISNFVKSGGLGIGMLKGTGVSGVLGSTLIDDDTF